MEFLFLYLILAVIPAMIARSKGRSFLLWSFYGFWVFPIALVHSLLIVADPQTRGLIKCTTCAEWIKRDAKICRYCHVGIPQDTKPEHKNSDDLII